MFAKLSALVGGGYTFPYTLEEPYDTAWGQWSHHRGKSNNDGSAVSVFKISATDPNDRRLACARNGIKRLKLVGLGGPRGVTGMPRHAVRGGGVLCTHNPGRVACLNPATATVAALAAAAPERAVLP